MAPGRLVERAEQEGSNERGAEGECGSQETQDSSWKGDHHVTRPGHGRGNTRPQADRNASRRGELAVTNPVFRPSLVLDLLRRVYGCSCAFARSRLASRCGLWRAEVWPQDAEAGRLDVRPRGADLLRADGLTQGLHSVSAPLAAVSVRRVLLQQPGDRAFEFRQAFMNFDHLV